MFRPMAVLFSRFGLFSLLMLLAGCGEREPAVITPPKDAAAVIESFLKELRAGQPARAAALVSPAAQDELTSGFATDHKKLASAPALTPRFIAKSGSNPYVQSRDKGGDGDEVTLVYAARQDGKWTSATVRVYRYRDEPYKVEYWRVTNAAPTPALNSNIDEAAMKQSQTMMYALFGAIALFGILGLALLVWLLKRKPHLIVPEPVEETRKNAATVRDVD
jgi:hypothetical protein